MPITERFVLNSAITEIQYRKGMVFLDRCGSIMVRLEESLAPAFRGSTPNMTQGQLVNAAERMSVVYGPTAFSVTQNWIASPVRLEQVAPPCWDIVAEIMNVGREVTRFGVRFQIAWGVADEAEAEARMARAGLFAETDEFTTIFGRPKARGWSAVVDRREGPIRVGLNANSVEIVGPVIEELQRLVPRHSILLDIDYVHPGAAPYAIHKGQMRDFIRASWEHAKETAGAVFARLAV